MKTTAKKHGNIHMMVQNSLCLSLAIKAVLSLIMIIFIFMTKPESRQVCLAAAWQEKAVLLTATALV